MLGPLALAPAADGQTCDGEPLLSEVARSAGLVFVHDRGATGGKYNPETMGAGLSWLDYDGDGWLDLYVVQSGPFPPDGAISAANRLFRNRGDGRFEDVTGRSAAGDRGYGQGVVAADVDGDDDTDLFLANYGPDRLLLNRGDGVFEDRTAETGLVSDGWSSAAALADVDRDGDLDLYLVHYLEHDPETEPFCANPETGQRWYCDPSVFEGKPDRFFRNLGDGRFQDATEASGFGAADGKGMGVLLVDLNDDRWVDVYVTNDMTWNFLFVNRGDGTFEDLSLLSGAAVSREGLPEAGMGVAVGDVDGDLDADLTVTNYDVQTNTLYLNGGRFRFEDATAGSGFGLASFNLVGFGLVLVDFDRDGNLDAFVANGHTVETPARANVHYAQPDLLLLGDGQGGFVSAPCLLPPEGPTVSRGIAAADYDGDGDPDVAVQRSGGALALMRNEVADGQWLGLELHGNGQNTKGVGARVEAVTDRGRQVRWVLAGDSYQSSSDPRLLFGFEKGTLIERLIVDWPTGGRQTLMSPRAGLYYHLREPG